VSDGAADSARGQLAASIETIERAYILFVLQAEAGNKTRAAEVLGATLEALHAALGRIGPQALAALGPATAADRGGAASAGSAADVAAYLAAVEQDARIARGAVALVLSRPQIASLLVDNLNASVHLRALLTDAFLLDQALTTA